MRYTGIQPQYFPRLHYFARALQTDIFVIRDDCQFVRKHKFPDGKNGKSHQADTPIKQSTGLQYLSVPVRHEGFKPIAETQISYDFDWRESHLKTLGFLHARCPFYKNVYRGLQLILGEKFDALSDLNCATIIWGILYLLGEKVFTMDRLTVAYLNAKLARGAFRLKKVQLATASQVIKKFANMDPNEKIVAMIKEVGANEDFCGGTAHTAYMQEDLFAKNGIRVTVQDWKCRPYNQLFPKIGFLPNLSIIDLLMNVPLDEAIQVIKG